MIPSTIAREMATFAARMAAEKVDLKSLGLADHAEWRPRINKSLETNQQAVPGHKSDWDEGPPRP